MQRINRISRAAPVVMSLLALTLALVITTVSDERATADEGAAAHIFQLLIACQIPLMLAFLATADWQRPARIAAAAALQLAALASALASVLLLGL